MLLPPTARTLWKILHSFAAGLPPGPLTNREQDILRAFLTAFDDALLTGSIGGADCACTQNWQQHLHDHPPVLTTRQAFQQWAYDIHDVVNAARGKPALNLHAPADPT
ncbi:MAG: ERV1/ALR-related protein [Verrucomicrobiaceae bacterium]|nr:ERV1/ALR-related protein [Verrucomicrobiaceae bacterium]